MFGRVVKAHATQQLAGRAPAQHIVEALPEVNVQVVQHQVNAASRRVGLGEQRLHEAYEVSLATVVGDRDDALSGLGLDGHEQVGRALADALVVLLGRRARRHGHRRAAVRDELQALLVDADHRLVQPWNEWVAHTSASPGKRGEALREGLRKHMAAGYDCGHPRRFSLYAGVAQLVEQRIRNAKVNSSIPFIGTIDVKGSALAGPFFLG